MYQTMYQTVQKAANDVDECKQMLVNMQSQLDRMEENCMLQRRLIGSLLGSKDQNKDKAMRDGGEGKLDKKTPIFSSIKKFEETSSEDSEDSSDEEEDEEKEASEASEEDEEKEEDEEERSSVAVGRSKLALVAMAGGAILIGGALQHQLR